MKLLALFLFLCASPLIAESSGKETLTIKGKTYHKGFIDKKMKRGAVFFTPAHVKDIPTTYDAIATGKATPVKGVDGQGSCGDCWAWSRTSALEAAAILANKGTASTVNLSEEDTTDNASDESGCGGGSMDFNYEINHGVTTTQSCPFTGGNGSCRNPTPSVQAYQMAYIGGNNGPTDAELTAAIYQFGSVSVTVAAGGNFNPDGNDEITDCGSQSIDHMVSLVGYKPSGVSSQSVMYKMKNSWGTSWGDFGGYAYLPLGCDVIATGEQSAMVAYVKGAAPVANLELPIEVLAPAGTPVALQAQNTAGLTLAWSDGSTGATDWIVSPSIGTATYTLTATDSAGNKTSSSVLVTISTAAKKG